MATFKLKRFSHIFNGKSDIVEVSERFNNYIPEVDKRNFSGIAIGGIGVGIAAILFAIIKFFKSKSGSEKYKATNEEISQLRPEFPPEYEILRKIQQEVIRECKYIFNCKESLDFYINKVPSLLNLNSEEFITGWARETGKTENRWAPVFVMYNSSFVGCYDFDKKYWFFFLGNKEYKLNTSFWDAILYEFKAKRKIVEEALSDYPVILGQALNYIDINIKLIKKYGKV